MTHVHRCDHHRIGQLHGALVAGDPDSRCGALKGVRLEIQAIEDALEIDRREDSEQAGHRALE
jgi:hypothetical protein